MTLIFPIFSIPKNDYSAKLDPINDLFIETAQSVRITTCCLFLWRRLLRKLSVYVHTYIRTYIHTYMYIYNDCMHAYSMFICIYVRRYV